MNDVSVNACCIDLCGRWKNACCIESRTLRLWFYYLSVLTANSRVRSLTIRKGQEVRYCYSVGSKVTNGSLILPSLCHGTAENEGNRYLFNLNAWTASITCGCVDYHGMAGVEWVDFSWARRSLYSVFRIKFQFVVNSVTSFWVLTGQDKNVTINQTIIKQAQVYHRGNMLCRMGWKCYINPL